MTNIASEVRKRKAVQRLDARIPPAIRWLAYVSTSRWRPHPPVHIAVARMADALEAEGWMIRGGWTRNYLLWRNGRTMREGRLPLLVLPLAFGRLSASQINVFLAVEIIEARSRLRQAFHRDQSPAEAAELRSVLGLIGVETGIMIADPFRAHREAMCALERLNL